MSERDDEALSAALAWCADRLAAALDEPPVEPPVGDSWVPDVSPDTYRRWLADQASARASSRRSGALPEHGPSVTIFVQAAGAPRELLAGCVDSVLAQTYRSWELLVAVDGDGDGGSGDGGSGSGSGALSALLPGAARADRRVDVLRLGDTIAGGCGRTDGAFPPVVPLRAGGPDRLRGEFVTLVDADATLDPEALAEVMAAVARHDDVDLVYTDEDEVDWRGEPLRPVLKPGWSPDLLLSAPYTGHLAVVRRSVLEAAGGLRLRPVVTADDRLAVDYDTVLRVSEHARRAVHVPRVLYHGRTRRSRSRATAGDQHQQLEQQPDQAQELEQDQAACWRAVRDAVDRRGLDAEVVAGSVAGTWRVRYHVQGRPSVAVIMPFRDQAALTARCLASLDRAPAHPIDEIVLVDNGSAEPETRALVDRFRTDGRVSVLDISGPFNWAAINNAAAATCRSEMLLFLNNDIEACSPGWLVAMVEHAQRPEVGAVGARLVYPDGSLQHGGVVLGLGGVAGHLLQGLPAGDTRFALWDRVVRPYSAVTGACLLVRRSVFDEVGGFDPAYAIAFNDVDFCLRLRRAGYRVLYTPHAELVHYESVSRGLSGYFVDYQRFLRQWGDELRAGDPWFSPNLSRLDSRCALKPAGEDEAWTALLDGLLVPEGAFGYPADLFA